MSNQPSIPERLKKLKSLRPDFYKATLGELVELADIVESLYWRLCHAFRFWNVFRRGDTQLRLSTIGDSGAQAASTNAAQPEPFLAEIYALSETGQIDAAIDHVINQFESSLNHGDWFRFNRIMTQADPEKIEASVAISILSMTFVEKARISTRPVFYFKLRRALERNRPADDVNRLLAGLQ